MRKLLIIIALGFTTTVFAQNMEVQISGDKGTGSALVINSRDVGDNSPWGLRAETYYSLDDNIQVGGIFGFGDKDTGVSELNFTLGVAARYNLNSDLANSFWAGVGVTLQDEGQADFDSRKVSAFVQAGKRFAVSGSLVYSPNVIFTTSFAGDDGFDSGSVFTLNLISFSGFLDI